MPIEDYHHHSAVDWRQQLKQNERKTRRVMVVFMLIYCAVGLLVDTVILQSMHPHVPLNNVIRALFTLQVIPYATLAMIGLGVVSILITYALYDRIMLLGTDYQEITPETAQTLQQKQLYNVVEEMKVAAGLNYMPKVFVINADYMNAFASGYSEKSAMIAITQGLMDKLDRAELQAVMAHELSHIRHHDIKLTLMVAVLSNILLVVIDQLFYSVVYGRDKRDNRLVMVIMVLRFVLPLVTLLLTLYLSRTREYMADSGCVELMRDNGPMGSALLKISEDHDLHAEQYAREYANTPHEEVRNASYLFDPTDINPVKSLTSSFSTHPTIKQRLMAIGFKLN